MLIEEILKMLYFTVFYIIGGIYIFIKKFSKYFTFTIFSIISFTIGLNLLYFKLQELILSHKWTYLTKYGQYLIKFVSNNSLLYSFLLSIIITFFLIGFANLFRLYGISRNLERIGLFSKRKKNIFYPTDTSKDLPTFLFFRFIGNRTRYYFRSVGISLNMWTNCRQELENILNSNFVKAGYVRSHGRDFKHYIYVEMSNEIPDSLAFSEDILAGCSDKKVALGLGMGDLIIYDFSKSVHLLVCGLTGSGKSVLIRCLAYQLLRNGAYCTFIDFKGGIEFQVFKEKYGLDVMSETKEVDQYLNEMIAEHKARIIEFKNQGCKNLDEYNKKTGNNISRIYIIVDEIAEMMDKTGISKSERRIIESIEGKLNTIARLCRATGIHLILGTQRPDSNVINGQIKNNIQGRVCGVLRDDSVSIMILGTGAATELEDIKGRFLYQEGLTLVKFQAYYFTDEDMKPIRINKNFIHTEEPDQEEIELYIPTEHEQIKPVQTEHEDSFLNFS